jgi:hypothetical protein
MIIIPANTLSTGAFQVDNSLRFEPNDNDHLERDPSSSGNRSTFTISFWMKLSQISTGTMFIINSNTAGDDYFVIRMENHKIECLAYNNGSKVLSFSSNALLRDPSAWYHVVTAIDTTQGTEANRFKMYLNGSQITSWATSDYPSQNATMQWNHTENHFIGCFTEGVSNFRGYLAEIVNIDGSQLAASSFGEFNEDSPTIWQPVKVSGLTFGTNGFYLNVPGTGTAQNASGMGGDSSGNGHHFSSSGLAANSSVTDTPTNNFVTWNPVDSGRTYSGSIDLSEGNLKQSNANDASLISTIAVNSGKWYMEFKCEDADNTRTFGIIDIAELNGYVGHSSVASAISYGYKSSDGTLWIGTSEQASSVGTTSAGDIVSMLIDLDSGTKTIKWKKNDSDLSGTTQLTISHTGYYWGIICRCDGAQVINANFGNPAYAISSGNTDANGYGNFEYAVPSGYYALCTKNLAEYG